MHDRDAQGICEAIASPKADVPAQDLQEWQQYTTAKLLVGLRLCGNESVRWFLGFAGSNSFSRRIQNESLQNFSLCSQHIAMVPSSQGHNIIDCCQLCWLAAASAVPAALRPLSNSVSARTAFCTAGSL